LRKLPFLLLNRLSLTLRLLPRHMLRNKQVLLRKLLKKLLLKNSLRQLNKLVKILKLHQLPSPQKLVMLIPR
jgi:hypothetical protein